MRLDIHVYHHLVDDGRTAKLDSILDIVTQLQRSTPVMTAALDRIRQEVAESRAVTQSAITLIGGLAAQILELKDDPAALEALANDLNQQQADMAAAITANTPAAPEPPPAEEPPAGGDTGGAGPDEGGAPPTETGGPDEGGGGPTETQP